MTLTIEDLDPGALKELRRLARSNKQTLTEYARGVLLAHLDQQIDKLLRPVREDFKRSGLTEERFHVIIEQARGEVHRARKPRRRIR